MFYENFKNLCKSKNLKPTNVVKELGLSSANMSNWKNGRKPKTDIALKIANYLNVSVEYLMGEPSNISFENNLTSSQPILSAHELKVILAYRSHPEMQEAVDRLLCIEQESTTANIGEDIATTLAAVPQSINKK